MLTTDQRNTIMSILSTQDVEGCREISDLNRARWHALNAVKNSTALSKIYPGAKVSFHAKGDYWEGHVKKIGRTKVYVQCGVTEWRCSPSLLTVIG